MPEEVRGPRAALGHGFGLGRTLDPCAAPGSGPGPTRTGGWRRAHGDLSAPTFCPIYSSGVKLPEARPFFQNSTRGAATTKNPKTGVLQPCPGTLPEGEIVIGGLFITMPASGEMRE